MSETRYPEEISIDDLANPKLNELQQSIIEYGETLEVTLQPDEILAEASESLKLYDYGSPDFLHRLQLLCDEWTSVETLTPLGLANLRGKLLQFARNRLLIEDTLRRHPEIHDVAIEAPIIVAGLPRSGTTHLLNLMAADSRLRSLPLWESYEPVPTPGEQKLEDGTDPRYQRCQDSWDMMQQTVPLLAAMHPMNPDHIHEELELMGPDFASYNFEWLCQCPRWRDHYYSTDQTPHYEYMKTVLKILTWQDGDKSGKNTRWVLKCPQHLEQLTVLHAVFPDATIVVTHRDPVAVIQSACTMLAYGQRMSRTSVDMTGTLDYWADRVQHLIEGCCRDRKAIPANQSIDVPFHEFMADDIAMVERIYERANLEMTETARRELDSFMQAHPRGKHGKIIYNLERDFGVSAGELRSRFKTYFENFPARPEKL